MTNVDMKKKKVTSRATLCELKTGDEFHHKVTIYFRHYKPKLILPLRSVLL